MIKNKTVLATICARGGSTGVKGKNIRLLGGIPLIIHSLELIKQSKYIDEYIISTDSEEIISICKEYGYRVDFTRPEYLAGPKVSRVDAIIHAAEWMSKTKDKSYDIIIDLGVATPLKNIDDVDNSIELFYEKNPDRLTSVCLCSRNPYYNMLEKNNGKVSVVKSLPSELIDRRDAPDVYDMNDGINIWSYKSLLRSNTMEKEELEIFVMPKERSIDIDEEIDFIVAKSIFDNNNK